MTSTPRDLAFAALAALVTGGCFLLALPFADLGSNDDWSYAYSALRYAQTARLEYVGWASTLLLFQVPYGALLIRWFGFSFDLLRLATLPFSLGCAVLLYSVFRLLRLERRDALFGTLTLTTSPLFTPLSASFMPDVYGLCFTLACLYCGLRALLSDSDAGAAVWLVAATTVGFAGGANRQIVWVAPIAVLLSFLWVKRRRPLVALAAALLAALLAGVFWVMRWYQTQPSAMYESPDLKQLLIFLGNPYLTSRLVLSTGLFLLPALLYRLPAWKCLPAWYYAVSVAAGVLYYVRPGESFASRLAPWMSNIVMPRGILGPGQDLPGDKPVVLTLPVRGLLTLAILGALSVWLFHFGRWIGTVWRKPWRHLRRLLAAGEASPAPFLLLSFFAGGTFLLSIGRPSGTFFDRYLLTLMPVGLIAVLGARPRPEVRVSPIAGWLALALFAAYGVATTHDYHATSRARVGAASLLQSAGVPRQHICAGFEFDGWTQLLATGYIRATTARPPAGTLQDLRPGWMTAPFWFLAHTPSIEPRYVVTFSPGMGLLPSSFAPISYSAWLPPFQRRLWIMKTAR